MNLVGLTFRTTARDNDVVQGPRTILVCKLEEIWIPTNTLFSHKHAWHAAGVGAAHVQKSPLLEVKRPHVPYTASPLQCDIRGICRPTSAHVGSSESTRTFGNDGNEPGTVKTFMQVSRVFMWKEACRYRNPSSETSQTSTVHGQIPQSFFLFFLACLTQNIPYDRRHHIHLFRPNTGACPPRNSALTTARNSPNLSSRKWMARDNLVPPVGGK